MHPMVIDAPELYRITTDVYERMADHGLLPASGIELLDGLMVRMSPKGDRHLFAGAKLNEQLVDQRRDRYLVCCESLSLRLGPNDEPEPDIAVARADRSFSRERPRPEEIALIVEIADTSVAFDLDYKRRKYAAAGIPEYWVVDIPAEVVHVFTEPNGGDYERRSRASAGTSLRLTAYPDVTVDVAALFV